MAPISPGPNSRGKNSERLDSRQGRDPRFHPQRDRILYGEAVDSENKPVVAVAVEGAGNDAARLYSARRNTSRARL